MGEYRVHSPHGNILLEASLTTPTPILMAPLAKRPSFVLPSVCILLGNYPASSAARLWPYYAGDAYLLIIPSPQSIVLSFILQLALSGLKHTFLT